MGRDDLPPSGRKPRGSRPGAPVADARLSAAAASARSAVAGAAGSVLRLMDYGTR